MDLNDYWQENKKFLTLTFGGLIVFLIGQMLIGSTLQSKIRKADASIRNATKALDEPMFSSQQLADLSAENEQLKAVVTTLKEAVEFVARDEFRLQDKGGRPTNQFFAIVTETRDELLKLAGRAGVRLPDDLGMPGLSPTHEDEIVRTLEALDVIDRSARLGILAGVARFDSLSIKLDPALGSRDGVGSVERTRVRAKISGTAASLLRFISATQDPRVFGQTLVIEEFQLQPARRKSDEATLELTFNVVRFHAQAELEN